MQPLKCLCDRLQISDSFGRLLVVRFVQIQLSKIILEPMNCLDIQIFVCHARQNCVFLQLVFPALFRNTYLLFWRLLFEFGFWQLPGKGNFSPMEKFKGGAFGCRKVFKGGQNSRMKTIWENKVCMYQNNFWIAWTFLTNMSYCFPVL